MVRIIMTKLLQEIQTYWTNRAEGYSQVNQGELHSEQKYKWQQTLLQYIPFKANKSIKILDIGTGPGFFAIILAQLGFDITAIDYTEQMLLEAKQNAGKLSEQIDFQQMDAQNLNFPDEKFDIIVTRNLTWNLENPQQAYSEWYRVLKKDGVFLILMLIGTTIYLMSKKDKLTKKIEKWLLKLIWMTTILAPILMLWKISPDKFL